MRNNTTLMILSNLIHDKIFATKVLPYLEDEFFITEDYIYFFRVIKDYLNKFNSTPSIEAIEVFMSKDETLFNKNEDYINGLYEILDKLREFICKDDPLEFRLKMAEEYCQIIAVENAIEECGDIISSQENPDEKKRKNKSSMLKILEDALSIKFESHLGSDFSDAESIYDQWHEKRFLIPSNLHILDKAMAGGFEPTNLYIFIANVGVGKSTLLVDLASRILRQKRNVLFVSLELSEIKIQERVIANLMNMNVNDLKNAERNPKNRFIEKMNHIKNGIGNFNVLYDSSGNCDVLHIKKIMADIKRNTGFKPDVIIIDHLSNLRSVALKRNQNVRGDEILESVSSEVKNMAGELGISVITAEQTRREARDKLFPGLEDIAGSHGISKKADFICSIGEDEQLIDEQMWQMNICKTRFSGMVNFRFKIKVNKDIQKTFDIITDGSGKETSQAPEEHETPTFTPESIKPNYRSAMPRRKRVISTSV